MFGLSTLVSRVLMGAVVLILLLGFLQVRSCQQERQQAAESRVERGQAKAGQESAKDAIETTGNVSRAEQGSADLTRTNEQEIRNAKGAEVVIHPDVSAAGLRSLCRRAVYRDTERCRLFLADPERVGKGR